jgi:hypothetical protein
MASAQLDDAGNLVPLDRTAASEAAERLGREG